MEETGEESVEAAAGTNACASAAATTGDAAPEHKQKNGAPNTSNLSGLNTSKVTTRNFADTTARDGASAAASEHVATAAQTSSTTKRNDGDSSCSSRKTTPASAPAATNNDETKTTPTTNITGPGATAAAATTAAAVAASNFVPIAPGPPRIAAHLPPWSAFPRESWTLLSLVHDLDWRANYLSLAQFRAVHGHVVIHLSPNASHATPQLVAWVQQQQLLYNDFLKQFEGKDFKSTDVVRDMFTKLELLRMLGFPFVREAANAASAADAESMENNKNDERKNQMDESGNRKDNLKNKRKATWDAQLLALRQFRDENGHCDPPNDSTLQNWVIRQRKRLKGEEKAAAPLAEEEVRRLEDVGIAALTKKKLAKISSTMDNASGENANSSNHRVPKNLADPERFDQMCEELKKFREEHGDEAVPGRKDGKLQTFLGDVRREYKKIKAGETSKFLTPIRIERLKQLDFSFEVGVKYTWDQRFEQWLQYRSQNNGKNPSTRTTLGKWVSKTRLRYHDTMEGKKVSYSNSVTHQLTDEQIEKLKRHAFDFGERDHQRTSNLKTWEERFHDLLVYKEEFGNVSVPQKYPGLGDWVHKQRQRRYQMSEDKRQKLEEVGFVWQTRKPPTRQKKESEEGGEELEESSGELTEDEVEESPSRHVGHDHPSQREFQQRWL